MKSQKQVQGGWEGSWLDFDKVMIKKNRLKNLQQIQTFMSENM